MKNKKGMTINMNLEKQQLQLNGVMSVPIYLYLHIVAVTIKNWNNKKSLNTRINEE